MLAKKWIGSLFATLCLGITSVALAQQQQQNGGPNGNQIPQVTSQQRSQLQLKAAMSATDDEWVALQPQIEKVRMLIRQRDRFINSQLSKPPKQQTGQGNPSPATLVDIKPDKKDAPAGTLNAVVLDAYLRLAALASRTDVSGNEMRASLAIYRAARERSDQELLQAQTELRQLVTTQQEVVLVLSGILD